MYEVLEITYGDLRVSQLFAALWSELISSWFELSFDKWGRTSTKEHTE
jgi:hypothetical protein